MTSIPKPTGSISQGRQLMHRFSRREMNKAVDYFQQAIDLDPDYRPRLRQPRPMPTSSTRLPQHHGSCRGPRKVTGCRARPALEIDRQSRGSARRVGPDQDTSSTGIGRARKPISNAPSRLNPGSDFARIDRTPTSWRRWGGSRRPSCRPTIAKELDPLSPSAAFHMVAFRFDGDPRL